MNYQELATAALKSAFPDKPQYSVRAEMHPRRKGIVLLKFMKAPNSEWSETQVPVEFLQDARALVEYMSRMEWMADEHARRLLARGVF